MTRPEGPPIQLDRSIGPFGPFGTQNAADQISQSSCWGLHGPGKRWTGKGGRVLLGWRQRVKPFPQRLVVGQEVLVMIKKGPLPLAELALEDLRQILQHLMQGIDLITGSLQLLFQSLEAVGRVLC